MNLKQSLFVTVTTFCETFAAVNRAIVARDERNCYGCTAFSTLCFKRFTWAIRCVVTLLLAIATAIRATARFVLETFFCIELLFTGCKNELGTTVFASNCFVLEHWYKPPKIIRLHWLT